jgi:hypothetical protein
MKANQRNAKKSTGPADTSKTRFNALRHGLCARLVVPGEDPAEYEAFVERLRGDVAPSDALEEVLAERAASAAWRLRRAQRAEAALINCWVRNYTGKATWTHKVLSEMGFDDGDGGAAAADSDPLGETYDVEGTVEKLDKLARYERTLEGGFYRALNALAELRGNGFVSKKRAKG